MISEMIIKIATNPSTNLLRGREVEPVDITISKNQALQILYLGYNDTVLATVLNRNIPQLCPVL